MSYLLILKKGKLTARIDELEAENSQQDDQILYLKSQISNLSPLLPQKSNYATNQTSNENNGTTPRVTTPPSSCEELTGYANLAGIDGIQLVQNKLTKKIEAVFCRFSEKPGIIRLIILLYL